MEYIPINILLIWILSVFIFLALRGWNSLALKNASTLNEHKKQAHYLFLICLLSSIIWSTSSILGLIYAPFPYAYYSLVMIILMVFAAAFSLVHFTKIYLVYSVILMSTQALIFMYKGGTLNFLIATLILVSIPLMILFTASIQKNRQTIIDLNSKLEKAILDIKSLQGIIPICSYCKNIRDEEGSWDQMEKYISSNSDAQFSHGICPDCLVKVRNDAGIDKNK